MKLKRCLGIVVVLGLALIVGNLAWRDDSIAPTHALSNLPLKTVVVETAPTSSNDDVPARPLPASSASLPERASRFTAFETWARRYAAETNVGARRVLESEGVEIARARLNAMADLISTNPEEALQRAVPFALRRALPLSVQAILEEPVNIRADLEVLGFAPLPGRAAETTPVLRYAVIEGERAQAFTFGRGLEFVTKRNVPINGIAVSAEFASASPSSNGLEPAKKLLALNPQPARVLDVAEVAEIRRTRAAEPLCPTSNEPTTQRGDETLIELGGKIESFCGKVHATDWANAVVAAQGLATPSSPTSLPTAASSYTEGRKRFLLMRPIFSDFTTTMTTNQALTHFNNFSNYMFEMSYGKLVFAGLDRGSDITPPLLVSGTAASYNDVGLSRLYPAARDVAASLGYDIAQYDFLYVVTTSRPSYSYAGLGYVGGVGFHLANSYFDAAVSSHEFGHNLGLNHANFWNTDGKNIIGAGNSVEYGDGNDPMGGGGSPNQYVSRYKNYLNWIPNSDIVDLNLRGSGRYRLYAFDLNYGSGVRGLKFTRNASQNYWVQFRQRKPGRAMENGVQLLWTGNGNQSSLLLDTRLIGNSGDNALVIGRTFSDTSLGLHLTPIGKGHTDPESIDVVANLGAFPANRPPSARITASTSTAAVGQPVTFTAEASDPNGDALAYYWTFGDSPANFSIDNQPTQTHTFTALGEFTVQCVVSDMKGGIARESVRVRAGTLPTFRISGRVVDTRGRPIAGVRVGTTLNRFTFTDNDGTYSLGGLSGGTYPLDATEPVSGALSFGHPSFTNPVRVGPDFVGADFIGVPGSLEIRTPLSAKNARWKYLDNGVDQGTAWRAPSFNDATWASGPGPLGYGQGGEGTILSFGPNANSKYTTYYFRRQFVVNNPAPFSNLLLETLRDDGVVVYLNGTEIHRDNLPSGTITFATPANDSVEPSSYSLTTLNANLLVAGTNTLAAEIHQSEPTSSDIYFDCALSGVTVSNLAGLDLVYLQSPASNARLPSGSDVTVTAVARAATGAVTRVEFFADGVKVGEAATPPYSAVWSNPADGERSVFAVASFSTGTQLTSAPVNVTIAPPPPTAISRTLIATGSVWRYLAGGTAAPPAWAQVEFDADSWPSGRAQLGYGDGDEATIVPFGGDAQNKWITTYFRRTFALTNTTELSSLVVRLLRDDGGIVYLNGVEIFRSNMPGGAVGHLTLAASATSEENEYFGDLVDPSVLRVGTNVVAVEIHQAAPNSGDISFDLSLQGSAFTNSPRGIAIVAPADNTAFTLPARATLRAVALEGNPARLAGPVEFFEVTDPGHVSWGAAPAPPYEVALAVTAAGSRRFFAVAANDLGQSLTSAPVTLHFRFPPVGTQLVSFGEAWKYLDDGSDQGTAWTSRTFDDRLWMSGPAKFGYGNDGERTTLRADGGLVIGPATAYFRKTFVVSSPSQFDTGLRLQLVRDDAAAVYLNGVEVFRDNLAPGPLSWNSLALAALNRPEALAEVVAVIPASQLVAGTNTLAVELHQSAITDSDAGFDLALTGLTATNGPFGVYLTSPANGARFNVPATVELAAYAAQGTIPILAVEFFANGAKLGEATATPYRFTWNDTPSGRHSLSARVVYAAGPLDPLTSPPISITVGDPAPPIMPVTETLIAIGTEWKYWDNVAPVGAGWSGPTFDDAAWPSARARFGWGLDGEISPLTEGRITHYFRRWFTVSNPARLTELVFQLARDDGAVVYLNGAEVFRSNMPGGNVAASTLAAVGVSTPDETTYFETTLAAAGSGLRTGLNLVAVELHQSSATSSDAGFDLQLTGFGTTEPRVLLARPANDAALAGGTPIELEAFASPPAGASVTKIEFFADGAKLGERASEPWVFSWSGAGFGPHTLAARATDSLGGVRDSAPVTVHVGRELVNTTLVPRNAIWRFLDNGSNQGTNWSQLNFNDAAWRSGPARLGFGGDGEVTVVNGGPSSARFRTTYFRRAFEVPAGVVINRLTFNLLRDDGAVVWLNGREAYRSNMPDGPITSATFAAATVNAEDEQTFFATEVSVASLPAGTNVVGVEVHQSTATSSDLSFALELQGAGYMDQAPPPLLSAALADGNVELSWPALPTGWNVFVSDDVTAPGTAWTPLAGTPVTVNGRNLMTVMPSATKRFFRLGK